MLSLLTILVSLLHANFCEARADGPPPGFPKGFMFGSATAAYQCEGAYKEDGRGASIWDVFSHIPGKTYNGDTGDLADDQYHLFDEDIDRMAWVGFDFYRFSISPTRILPNGTLPVNQKGIDHYNKVIDYLIKRGVKPFVTLYHWDYPNKLDEEYEGWLSEKSTADFLAYAEICFKAFGDRVKYWLTFNEPWTFTFQGYGIGVHAPGRCSDRSACKRGNSSHEPYVAAHNVLRTHARAVELYRRKYQEEQGGKIGITLNTDWAEPYTNSTEDLAAAERSMMFQFGWFAHPVFYGDYPSVMRENCGERLPTFSPEDRKLLKGSLDFLGLNHYGSHYSMNPKSNAGPIPVNFEGWVEDQRVVSTYYRNGKAIGPQGDSPWLFVAPWGFYKLLHWVKKTYSPKAIIVTENGVDVPNENTMPIHKALKDTFRLDFYRSYIGAMKRAIQEGVPVKGYTAWSFLDNYEWADGYLKRFGLFYVHYENQTRFAKDSVKWFRSFLAGNASAPSIHKIPQPPPPSEIKGGPPVAAVPNAETAKKHVRKSSGVTWVYFLVGIAGVACALVTVGAICVYCRRNHEYSEITELTADVSEKKKE